MKGAGLNRGSHKRQTNPVGLVGGVGLRCSKKCAIEEEGVFEIELESLFSMFSILSSVVSAGGSFSSLVSKYSDEPEDEEDEDEDDESLDENEPNSSWHNFFLGEGSKESLSDGAIGDLLD